MVLDSRLFPLLVLVQLMVAFSLLSMAAAAPAVEVILLMFAFLKKKIVCLQCMTFSHVY